jgi:hypothetical protein
VLFLAALAWNTPAEAAPILVTQTPTVTASIFFDNALNPTYLGFTPGSLANVDNTEGLASPAGVVVSNDADAAPIDSAVFFDFVDEAIHFQFDFGSSGFDFGAGIWSLFAAGSPLAPFEPITDPSLTPFLAPNNIALFSILFVEQVFDDLNPQIPIGLFAVFALDTIAAPEQAAIPEPATLALLATGLAFFAAARRRRATRG